MKKHDFENRLANDLFPEMPASFEQGLKKTLQAAGVKPQRRPTAAGVFAGVIGVAAAAACLLIVLLGVFGGGKSKTDAAAPGGAAEQAAESTPMPMDQATPIPMDLATPMPLVDNWKGTTKVVALSDDFNFENREKYEALYQGVLRYLKNRGEAEPDELWLCAVKTRFVGASNAEGGCFVLAQHAFGPGEGPELYCIQENGVVLWSTEGSSLGPNHAVNPLDDSPNYAHFLYGAAPADAEAGVLPMHWGAVVGSEPMTDIVFSKHTSIQNVRDRLTAAGSAHMDCAREHFLASLSGSSWENALQNAHTLRFEMEDDGQERVVDVDMEKALPLVETLLASRPSDADLVKEVQQGIVQQLSEEPRITDLTDDRYGTEIVQRIGEAVARALQVSGTKISSEGIWICGIEPDGDGGESTPPESAYVLALYAFDGGPFPELFYYHDGAIEWMTTGGEAGQVNVVQHNGNVAAFGISPAYDGKPIALEKITVSFASMDAEGYAPDEAYGPVLPLEQVQQRVPQGPSYWAAREYFLIVKRGAGKTMPGNLAFLGQDGKTYRMYWRNALELQTVPAMAVESDGTVYPGRVTLMAHSLNQDGAAAEGTPLEETMANGILFKTTYAWRRPLTILTAYDAVSVDQVDVYRVTSGDNAAGIPEQLDTYGVDLELSRIDDLPAGEYYLCFHTTVLGPYSEKAGRYTFETDYTIYKVALGDGARLILQVGDAAVEGRHLFFADDPDGDGIKHYLMVDGALHRLPTVTLTGEPVQVSIEGDMALAAVLVYDEQMEVIQEGKDLGVLNDLTRGTYRVCFFAKRSDTPPENIKTSMDDVEVFAFEVTVP